jgi:hypothetical protein
MDKIPGNEPLKVKQMYHNVPLFCFLIKPIDIIYIAHIQRSQELGYFIPLDV